jgi:hypothetical protein
MNKKEKEKEDNVPLNDQFDHHRTTECTISYHNFTIKTQLHNITKQQSKLIICF